MRFDANKLTQDLIHANKLACDYVSNIGDGGTANLDNVFLQIPHARETTVLNAIKNAGLYCRCKTKWLGNGYMINPTTGGQGNRRSKGVEIMAKELERLGWDVMIFYKND